MLGPQQLISPFAGVLTRVRAWPVTAQQEARRNAMVAATACARRRIEREEVADYLSDRARDRTDPGQPDAGRRPGRDTPAHG